MKLPSYLRSLQQEFEEIPVRPSFFIALGILIGVGILINILLKNPVFDNLPDKADFELQIQEPGLAEETLLQIISQDPFTVAYHDRYIRAHFAIPKKRKVGKSSYEYRDDQAIQDFYNGWAQSADPAFTDIGFYGKGLIQANFKNYPAAIAELQQVKNKNLPYLNDALGVIYRQMHSNTLAEQHFRKEIDNQGNIDSAYTHLIQLLFDKGRTTELKAYLKQPEIAPYFPPEIERSLYFQPFQPAQYGLSLFRGIAAKANAWGAVTALLILCCWVLYLRRLDIFEAERWTHVIVTVFLGLFFGVLIYPLSDFDHLIFGFKPDGSFLNDFFYHILGIGALEELIKIAPLLLLLRFSKAVNEPFDYIKYASLSALGVAFVQNLIYFKESHLYLMHGIALSTSIFGMFTTSIVAYTLVVNKYKRHKNPYVNFILFFVLASILNGLHDFWFLHKPSEPTLFNILSFVFLFVSLSVWNSFITNTLSHSDFYDSEKSIDHKKLQDYLIYTLTGILLFEYLAVALNFGPRFATDAVAYSALYLTLLMIFLAGGLLRFPLIKGHWAPISYVRLAAAGDNDYEKVVGANLQIEENKAKDAHLSKYLPNSGKIFKRLELSYESDWYLIKLDAPKQSDSYLKDTILIRTKVKNEALEKGKSIVVVFYLIPKEVNPEKKGLERTDFKFCGWANLSLENEH